MVKRLVSSVKSIDSGSFREMTRDLERKSIPMAIDMRTKIQYIVIANSAVIIRHAACLYGQSELRVADHVSKWRTP